MPFSQPLTRVRLRQRKKIGPGVAATANPRTNPLSSRLDTRTSHGPQILLMERRGQLEAVHRQAGDDPQYALADVTDRLLAENPSCGKLLGLIGLLSKCV